MIAADSDCVLQALIDGSAWPIGIQETVGGFRVVSTHAAEPGAVTRVV